MPLTESIRSALCFQSELESIRSAISFSILAISRSSVVMTCLMLLLTSLSDACCWRLSSLVRMPMSWRRRRGQILEAELLGAGERTRDRLEDARELGQDVGVHLVGLGQPADGLGKVAGLARVDDGDGVTGFAQLGGELALQATGGLHDDQLDVERLEAFEQ